MTADRCVTWDKVVQAPGFPGAHSDKGHGFSTSHLSPLAVIHTLEVSCQSPDFTSFLTSERFV